jgi:two-component system, OmpR family, sensor histidine kinase KdpD
MDADLRRPAAAELLKDLGAQARLTVFVSFAPGAGKTYRLIGEALQLRQAGAKVMIGWLETKGRADLDRLAADLPRIPPRMVERGTASFPEFDFEAAVRAHPDVVVLDELAHTNLPGSTHAKRWQDALALRDAGISVLCAMNIAHLDSVAATAEGLIGYPIREIVPLSFLKAADQVIAIDIEREQLESRLYAGAIVRKEDIDRALQGPLRPQTLRALREIMLKTIDALTVPALPAARVSAAVALVLPGSDPEPFLTRMLAFADAFNLEFTLLPAPGVDGQQLQQLAGNVGAQVIGSSSFDFAKPRLQDLSASLVGLSSARVAREFFKDPVDRDVLVVAKTNLLAKQDLPPGFRQHPYAATARDRMRVGYGRLTVYLGAAAGCGKTYAMLEQAHQLQDQGVDVVVAFVETHGRVDTAKKLEGLEILPRRELQSGGVRTTELDFDALLRRRPQVALIDELAHTNAPGSKFAKRYEDVLSVLRTGISVLTTLNVQHLEGLNDVVHRLTGVTVRETMPDGILELADDIVLIDASAQTLRDRLRAGKIYPPERIDAALSSFFRTENLTALRELALREALRARAVSRAPRVVSAIILGVAARERDTGLVQRAARLAKRLDADFSAVHVAATAQATKSPALETLAQATRMAGGTFAVETDANPARGLARVAAGRPGATLVVEGVRGKAAWLGPKSFAERVLEHGAPELLVLAPILD